MARAAGSSPAAGVSSCRPWAWPREYRRRATKRGPRSVSSTAPPTSSSSVPARRGGEAAATRVRSSMRRMTWRSSAGMATGASGAAASAGGREPPQDGEGDGLGAATHLVHRTHTRRASRAAGAGLEGGERLDEELREDLEDALGEADAAGLAVVEVERGSELFRAQELRPLDLPRHHHAFLGGRAVAEPRADVAHVAEEEDRRQVVQEIREGAEPVHELLAARRDRGEEVGGEGEPGAGGLHLLLGQLHLTRAHVLQSAELDLLESHDLLGDEHLALFRAPAGRVAAGEALQHPHALRADGVGEVVDLHALDVRDL